MEKDSVKVFISYSWDSDGHKDKVLALSNKLRKEGIDCSLDQYETTPEEKWHTWMAKQIEKSDFVLMICTETYLRRLRKEETEGVGKAATFEADIISKLLLEGQGKNLKFVPVIFSEEDKEFIPPEIGSSYYCATKEDGYDALYRYLTDQKNILKPELGEIVNKPPKATPVLTIEQTTQNRFFNVPIHQNHFFTGREDILKKLRENLEASKQTALTQQALSGLGGVGKTQIAVEYAYRYRDSYHAVLWVEAESETSLHNSAAEIACLLDLPQKDRPEPELVRQAVQNWLSSQTNWLLVLDNIEDMKLYKSFVPTSAQGHVILTTRLHSTGNVKKLQIDEMKEDGVLFLLRRSGAIEENQDKEVAKSEDLESAKKINEIFDGLALALEQAGAYVEKSRISLARYLEIYNSSGNKLLSKRAKDSDYPKPVARAFDLSLKKTRESSPAAYELIQLCAFYDPDSIPELIFKEGQEHLGEKLKEAVTEELEWEEVIEEACRFSLLQRNVGEESFRMHRVLQQAIRISLDDSKDYLIKVLQILNLAFPDPGNLKNWPVCAQLLPSIEIIYEEVEKNKLETTEVGDLFNGVGWYLEDRGFYGEAEHYYDTALRVRKVCHGEEHIDVATSLNNLAELYRNQGRYEEAEPLYKEALKMRKKLLGEEHPSVATSLNNLALLYDNQGRYEEAEPLYKDALEMYKKLLGEEHPDVAFPYNNLGILYINLGNFIQAEEYLQKALDIIVPAVGWKHPNVISTKKILDDIRKKLNKG